jgi:hypothetical protein
VTPKDIPLARPEDYEWVKLESSFITTLTSSPELGRLMWTMNTPEVILRKLLGDAIYSNDTSPPPRLAKKNKAYGMFTPGQGNPPETYE